MSPTSPRAFISYSHDSAEHDERVRALADRLCGDGVDCTIDQYDPHPREPWPRWMDRQIEDADFVLVVCTETYLRRAKGVEPPGVGLGVAFESVLIVQDLYDAGMWNEKFIPVLFDGASPQSIPKPLRGYTRYKLDAEYESLLRHLRNEPRVRKPEVRPGVPLPPADSLTLSSQYRCMAQPPEGWVHRREYDEVREALCSKEGAQAGRSVGITTALRGAGGFGKTALAQKLCFDERVRETYPDGILWATMGEDLTESGRLSRIRDLIRWWTHQEAPAFETVNAASAELRDLLARSRVLIVVDDAWKSSDVAPFQGHGEGSALLVTTRVIQALPEDSLSIPVDAMASSEAVSLLERGLPDAPRGEIGSLAARLGEWALLLTLVNGTLKKLVKGGLSVPEALQRVHEDLDAEGFSAFDQNDSESRHAAASKTILVSTKNLSEKERELFFDLAIFPEDEDIPLAVLERYWGLKRSATRRLCDQLYDLSLLRAFDQKQELIRLHDVSRQILMEQRREDLPALHGRLLGLSRPASGEWKDLPGGETYLWRRLAYHLLGAGKKGELRVLLLSFPFLSSKLRATDINSLIGEYEPFVSEDQGPRLVQSALRLSSHVLAKDRAQLASQLIGRLPSRNELGLQALLEGARFWQESIWLRPRTGSLTQAGGALVRTLEGHTSFVLAVAVLDGRRAVSGASDGTLRVWDLENGKTLQILEGHTAEVRAVVVLADGRAVSGSDDATLRVWDLKSGKILRTLEGHMDRVRAVAVLDGGRVVSGSDDETLRVWDLESGQILQTLKGHTDWVNTVAVLGVGRVVSGSADDTLRVWDLKSGQTLQTLKGHIDVVNAVAVLSVGRVVSGSDDGTLRVWDLESGQTLQILKGHTDWVNAVAVLGVGRAVSGSYDGTLRVWDLESGQTLQTLEGHTGGVNAVAVLGGGRAVSSSYDETLRVWDLERGQTFQTLVGHTDGVNAVAVLGGGRAVSSSYDETLRVWDLERGQTFQTLVGHTDGVNALAVLGVGRAVSSSYDETLRVWDLESGQTLQILEGHMDRVNAVAVLSGCHTVSGSDDGMLRIWDLESGRTLRTLEGHTGVVNAVAELSGGRAVSGSSDWTLRVWDLESGRTLQTLEGHTGGVNAVAELSGGRAVSGSDDGTLRMWDLESGRTLQTLEGHTGVVNAVAELSGGRAVSGASDWTLRVWDLESGQTLQTLEGHTGGVNAVAVLEGGRAVSGSDDGTLRVWDLEGGEALAVVTLDVPVWAVAASPDGKIIVAGDQAGKVHFFDLVEPELREVPHVHIHPS